MKYALLIYDIEDAAPDEGTPEAMEIYQEYFSFTEDITNEGINEGGEALNRVDTATTVRVRDGELAVTDGPFAETKEQLGGFYLIDVDDLDQAINAASRIPAAKTGSIEVRPLWVWDEE
ncbi:MAG: YciI family protein [Acidimicrobiia bacterium]